MPVKIGLFTLWAQKLLRSNGQNLTAFRLHEPKVGMQILVGNLLGSGYDVRLIDLKRGQKEMDYGQVVWCNERLTKVAVGSPLPEIDTSDLDVVGITVQYHQGQEIAIMVISEMKRRGHKIVVGGSETLANPDIFLEAGADVAVLDKSGASNHAAIEMTIGKEPQGQYRLKTAGGLQMLGKPCLHPDKWTLPPLEVAYETLGTEYWEGRIPEELLPIGSVMPDQGCDRHCEFCQTPASGLRYQAMSPRYVKKWLDLQKEAGARSVVFFSDQFLGRQLRKGGRDEILQIMSQVRGSGLPVLWGNGLELAKATNGRGRPQGDPTPNIELIDALWGWDPKKKIGCAQSYIAGERPVEGPKMFDKLLGQDAHLEMMRVIASVGVPYITYGVIVGFEDDSEESLGQLHRYLSDLREEIKKINPNIRLDFCPFALRPISGTPLGERLRSSGLMEYTDPAIVGGFWPPCARTRYLTVKEVFEWQRRIVQLNDSGADWQGVSALKD